MVYWIKRSTNSSRDSSIHFLWGILNRSVWSLFSHPIDFLASNIENSIIPLSKIASKIGFILSSLNSSLSFQEPTNIERYMSILPASEHFETFEKDESPIESLGVDVKFSEFFDPRNR